MKVGYIWVALFFCFVMGSLAKPQQKLLTVATYNINWGNPNLKETVRSIKKLKADFIALQETTPRAVSWLKSGLRKTYPYSKFVRGRQHNAGGFGFLSKYPLENVRFIKPEHGLFGAYYCEVKVHKVLIKIYSLHLQPTIPKKKSTVLDLMKAMMVNEKIRKLELRKLFPSKKTTDPMIVLGDLNSYAGQFAPKFLKEMLLLDSFAEVNKSPDDTHSFHRNYKGIALKYRIDYIFHSSHFKTHESRIWAIGKSDHYPVVSQLLLVRK